METKSFIICGQELTYTGDLDDYMALHRAFIRLCNEHYYEFEEAYTNAETVEDAIKIATEKGIDVINKIYMGFAEFYLNIGIYDFSENMLHQDGAFDYVIEPLYKTIKEMKEQYDNIKEKEYFEKYRRKIRKESRGKFIGGGFGLTGAITGIIGAGIMNMGTGLAHSAYNAVGNAMTSAQAYSEKQNLYEENKDYLLTNFVHSINRIFTVVNKQLQIHVNFDFRKSNAIINNIRKGIIKEPILSKAIIDGITADPFNEFYYVYFLNKLEDENSIYTMADYFDVDLSKYKIMLHSAYGTYFEDPVQAKLVNDIMDKLKITIDENTDSDISEHFMESGYFERNLNVSGLTKVIEAIKNIQEIPDSAEEVKQFFYNLIDKLSVILGNIKLEVDKKAKEEADRKAAEEAKRKAKEEADRKAAKELEDRKALFANIDKGILAKFVCKLCERISGEYLCCCSKIPEALLHDAYNLFGEKMNIYIADAILVVNTSYSKKMKRGILMTSTEIVSDRKNVISLKDITRFYTNNGKIYFDTKEKKNIEFYQFYADTDDYYGLVYILTSIFDPINIQPSALQHIKRYYEEIKPKLDIANSLSLPERAKILGDYFANKNKLTTLQFNPLENDNIVQNAFKTYASKLGANSKNLLLLYDDAILESGKKGFLLTTDGIYTSRKEKYLLNNIQCIIIRYNKECYISFKDASVQEIFHMSILPTEEALLLNKYLSYLFNQEVITDDIFDEFKKYYNSVNYTQNLTCQEVAYMIDGDLQERISQINNIPNMPSFENIYIGKNLPNNKISTAIATYLNVYSENPNDIWLLYAKNDSGSEGFSITRKYILNHLNQGFELNKIKTIQLTYDGHLYVITKDNQGYYLMDNIDTHNINVINQILTAVFSNVSFSLNLCKNS